MSKSRSMMFIVSYPVCNYRRSHATADAVRPSDMQPLSGSSFSCRYPDRSLLHAETPSQHDSGSDPPCAPTNTLLQGLVHRAATRDNVLLRP
jgi:hypothetical protein